MRCLVVADLHYSLRQWDWVLQNAGQFDVVVIAGDLLDLAGHVDLDAQIVVVLKYLRRVAAVVPRLLVTSGNHDLDDRSRTGEGVATWLAQARNYQVSIDGDSWELDGWRFTLCPWWDGPHTRDGVSALLARDGAKRARRWVWVHHAPPDQSRVSWNGRKFAGDPELAAWIQEYQPCLVLSGHIHQAPFQELGGWFEQLGRTWAFNAGHYLGAVPPSVVLDLAAGTAEWNSEAGRERIEFRMKPEPAMQGNGETSDPPGN